MKYIIGAFALFVIVGGAWLAYEITIAEEWEEVVERLYELEEKATPKKVEVIDYDYCYYECPRCGVAICWDGDKEGHKHCIDCGQALDWSEEDE